MYSTFKLAKKYIDYYLSASSGKGHGIHSPFVFDFITNVLSDKKKYLHFDTIEKVRSDLLRDNRIIEVEDFGAGSSVMSSNKRAVKDIARTSLKNEKFGQLFFRIVNYYKPGTIIELGTSLGITTAYMASADHLPKVYSLEGSNNIISIAQDTLHRLDIKNLKLIKGNFDKTLPALLSKIEKFDLAFVDGNHRKEPTIQYFSMLLERSNERSIFIFDDIHWSADMEEAWQQIQQHPSVTLTIDLFFIGLVFFNKNFKAKQHFIIRF